MSDSKLLTVIVPIYNVELYLEQCLDSLVYQTDQCFKAILINDGSSDGSPQIAKRYSSEHPALFSYYEQPNKGQGAARNHALLFCDTPYVTFLDSDDWWLPRNMEEIHRALINSNSIPDLIFTCPTVYDMTTHSFSDWNDNEQIKVIFKKHGDVLNSKDTPELFNTEASICRVIVKTSLLMDTHFCFPEGIKWEDIFAHFFIIQNAQNCVLIQQAGFIYRIGSRTQTTALSDHRRLEIVPAFSIVFEYAFSHDWSDVVIAYIFNMLMSYISWFFKATSKDIYPALIHALHKFAVALPSKCYKAYCQILHPEPKSKLLWLCLKSNLFYRVLLSSERYTALKQLYFRFRRK